MSTKKQKERKKKEREAKAKARVLSRRHQLRAATRDENRAKKLENKFREKLNPIVNDPEKQEAIERAREEKVKERLERNMQILKALEEEYEAEQARKKEISEELESQGHKTLKEKLDAMEAFAREKHAEDSAQENS